MQSAWLRGNAWWIRDTLLLKTTLMFLNYCFVIALVAVTTLSFERGSFMYKDAMIFDVRLFSGS